jgi:anti-sigma factor RsiW
MTPDPLYERLLETSWRRKLTETELAELQTFLTAHPELQAQWETEANLNQLLDGLTEAPLPSNFTSRVLAELDRQTAAEARNQAKAGRFWSWRARWLPRAAFAAVVVGSGLLAYRQHSLMVREHVEYVQHQELANDLAKLAPVGSVPSQILTNYDAIRLMSAVSTKPTADTEILRLLE